MSVVGVLCLVGLLAAAAAGVAGILRRAGCARGSVATAATLAILAVCPDLCGRPFHDVAIGTAITAAALAPGALWLRGRRSSGPDINRVDVVILAVMLGGLAWCAWTTWIWDERIAHFGVAASIARGALPAILPQFPDEPFAYHAGFDVLAGIVRRFSHAPVDDCIDVVSTVIGAGLLWGLHDVGFDLAGRPGARAAPVVGLLGYGPLSLCIEVAYGLVPGCSALFPTSWRHPVYIPPPVVSSFFQHPQGLGAVVGLAVLQLAVDVDHKKFGAGAVLLTLLAQAHIVFFMLLGFAVAVVVGARAVRTNSLVDGAVRGLVLSACLAIALLMAGFFSGGTHAGFVLGGHFPTAFHVDAWGAIGMNLVIFTPAVVALPIAVARAGRSDLRLALVVASLTGFIVGNAVSYERSWDIVKFFGAGALFANLLFVDAIGLFFAKLKLPTTLALLALTSLAGGAWLLRFGPLNGAIAPRYTEREPSALGRALDDAFGDRLGTDRVLTRADEIQELGFLVVGSDWRTASRGLLFDRARLDDKTKLRDRALTTLAPDDIAATGARFMLLSVAEIAALDDDARAHLAQLTHDGGVDANGTRYELYSWASANISTMR